MSKRILKVGTRNYRCADIRTAFAAVDAAAFDAAPLALRIFAENICSARESRGRDVNERERLK